MAKNNRGSFNDGGRGRGWGGNRRGGFRGGCGGGRVGYGGGYGSPSAQFVPKGPAPPVRFGQGGQGRGGAPGSMPPRGQAPPAGNGGGAGRGRAAGTAGEAAQASSQGEKPATKPRLCVTCQGSGHEWKACVRNCAYCGVQNHQGQKCPVADSLGLYPKEKVKIVEASDQVAALSHLRQAQKDLRDDLETMRAHRRMLEEMVAAAEQGAMDVDEEQDEQSTPVGGHNAVAAGPGPGQWEMLKGLFPGYVEKDFSDLPANKRKTAMRNERRALRQQAIKQGLLEGEVKEKKRKREDEDGAHVGGEQQGEIPVVPPVDDANMEEAPERNEEQRKAAAKERRGAEESEWESEKEGSEDGEGSGDESDHGIASDLAYLKDANLAG